SSPAMAAVFALALRAAPSSIPILLEGETGVGKEWLADAIRAAGPRAKKPFVTVNCGALPHALAESILFGHEKGAFTDAGERHRGKFVEADGGTLFLDEVGELPRDLQVKLLRVLQKGEVDPVGARAAVSTDVRVISATNRDLAEEVRSGRFREDLYYRLNVLPIRIPPLRDRRAEIADLCSRFISGFSESEGRTSPLVLSGAALRLLQRHDWPGNVRQLQNAIHRAVVLAESEVLGVGDFPQIAALVAACDGETAGFSPSDTPADGAAGGAGPSPIAGALAGFDAFGEVRTVEAVEADLIRLAMVRYDGRMTEIARRLAIGRSTLYRKMRLYSIAGAGAASDDGTQSETLRETSGFAGPS
ncbi:MAG: sigma-54-dependent Fis family transcriptional regulator, partial [Rhizobiaceae bacterium]|nr:sigma-54-dependent Fis family transcriptional regulator [Rhizobiaceae bacterium]